MDMNLLKVIRKNRKSFSLAGLLLLFLPVFSQQDDNLLEEEEARSDYDMTMRSGVALQLNASAGVFHFGAGVVAGYRFNRRVFLGVGAEPSFSKGFIYSLMTNSSGHYSIPAFFDAKFYLSKKNITPYFNFRAGYAFPLHKEVSHMDPYINHTVDHPDESCVCDREETLKGIYTGIGFGLKVKRSDFSLGVVVNEMHYHHVFTYSDGCRTESDGFDICPNGYFRYSYTLQPSSLKDKNDDDQGFPESKCLDLGMAVRFHASTGLLDLPRMLVEHDFGFFNVGGSVGYQFSPSAYFGLGAEYYVSNQTLLRKNIDYDRLCRGSGCLLRSVPVFADFKMSFSQRLKSLFAEIRLGYSIPLRTTVTVIYGQDFFAGQEGSDGVGDDFIYGEVGKQMNGLYAGLGLGYEVGRSAYSLGVNIIGVQGYQKSYYEYGELRYNESGVNTNVYFRYGFTLQ